MSIQTSFTVPPPAQVAATSTACVAPTYAIPVNALGVWRREIPAAPMAPVAPAPVSPPPLQLAAAQANAVVFTIGQTIEQVEREMIIRTIHATRGNRTRAAKLLGISVRTLYTKLRALEVSAGIAPAGDGRMAR